MGSISPAHVGHTSDRVHEQVLGQAYPLVGLLLHESTERDGAEESREEHKQPRGQRFGPINDAVGVVQQAEAAAPPVVVNQATTHAWEALQALALRVASIRLKRAYAAVIAAILPRHYLRLQLTSRRRVRKLVSGTRSAPSRLHEKSCYEYCRCRPDMHMHMHMQMEKHTCTGTCACNMHMQVPLHVHAHVTCM